MRTIRRMGTLPRLAGFALLMAAKAAVATGFLSLESSPTGAEVWYTGPEDPDKKYLGDTPLENREMSTGRYNLWLILPSHDTLAVPDVVIVEGQVTQLNREIPTHYGYLEVATDPDSSDLWLDGVMIGTSPHVNNLVLPGSYKLRVMPHLSHFKNASRNIQIGKGDSLRIAVESPYRDKSFFQENLSLAAWRLQLEAGLQYRSVTGAYDTAGKRVKRATDSIGTQWDYPLQVRLGLPEGFEIHMLLPFKSYDEKTDTLNAPFRSNMRFGVKYTYRPLNVGFDATYAPGIKNSREALNHDMLALTALAMASKGKLLGQAQAGFEFHFADKVNNKINSGDAAFVHAQVGYLFDPVTPYLGLTGRFQLNGDSSGTSDSTGGYVVTPELGLVVDVDDLISLQFGIPFTILGKGGADPKRQEPIFSDWGLHFSASLGFNLK